MGNGDTAKCSSSSGNTPCDSLPVTSYSEVSFLSACSRILETLKYRRVRYRLYV